MLGGFASYPILTQDDDVKLGECIEKGQLTCNSQSDLGGTTILSAAVICGATRCFNLLLKSGADVNRLDINKRSALYYSIYCTNVNFALALIEAGTKLDVKFEGRFTPLAMCLLQRFSYDSSLNPIIEALLLAGAKLENVPVDVPSWIIELAQKVEAHRQLSLLAYATLRKTKQTFIPREIATMIAKMVWENRKK
jgi:ankyrin repeat protein